MRENDEFRLHSRRPVIDDGNCQRGFQNQLIPARRVIGHYDSTSADRRVSDKQASGPIRAALVGEAELAFWTLNPKTKTLAALSTAISDLAGEHFSHRL